MRQLCLMGWMVATAACSQIGGVPASAPPKPIPIAELAVAAQRELGAMMEILESDRATRLAMSAVNGALVKSGLGRGLPSLPAPEDAEACFRNAAASRGLQITSTKSQAPEPAPAAEATLQPGKRWQVKRNDLLGAVAVEVVVNGPLPSVAALIDEIAQCNRLVAVRSAKVEGSTVTLKAEAWFEHNLATPELQLRWRSLDERLEAAGWRPNDPALLKDPAYAQLKSAVDAGREQLPRARALLKTSVDLPRWITRARELVVIKQEILQIRGAKLLGLKEG
jgi:hypothetical protein